MSNISRVLAQNTLATTTNTDLYTVPAGYSATITMMTVARSTAAAGSFPKVRIAIRPGGETLASKHYIVYDVAISGADGFNNLLPVNFPLASGDVVTAYADQPDCTINLYGTEQLA